MAEVEDKLLDHNFDGIQEYDNPLPPWWVYFFIASIIWGGAYIYYYHIAEIGPGSKEEYSLEVKDYEIEFADAIIAAQNINWENPEFEALKDDGSIMEGQLVFQKNCATCHGKAGEGGNGPNLTDDYWIHGPEFKDIVRTIAMGVQGKAMISWKSILKKDDIIKAASYIKSIKGTNPPNPKQPEGQLYK